MKTTSSVHLFGGSAVGCGLRLLSFWSCWGSFSRFVLLIRRNGLPPWGLGGSPFLRIKSTKREKDPQHDQNDNRRSPQPTAEPPNKWTDEVVFIPPPVQSLVPKQVSCKSD